MAEIEIPPYFICPISLEIMRDPVTVCTGITYDRESIENWMFNSKKRSCPVTKQLLPDSDLTPNHTLRRLMQAWCIENARNGIERISTPKPAIDKIQILKLVDEAKNCHSQFKSLQRLKVIALESERNKRCMEDAGLVNVLVSIAQIKDHETQNCSDHKFSVDDFSFRSLILQEGTEDSSDCTRAREEALSFLCDLNITEDALRKIGSNNSDFVDSLTEVLKHGNYKSRGYAIFLLKSIFYVLDPFSLIGMSPHIFHEVVHVLHDKISHKGTKAALQILMELNQWGRNRIKAAESGAVPVLIELIIETQEKRSCEMMMVVLDQLCGCAEGRSQLLGHAAGLAIVSKKILRVSQVATERAVRILSSIARFSSNASVLQEMLQVGAVSKLCLLLQVECSMKSKKKAKEILILHSTVLRNSNCVPLHLLASYPSCR